MKSRKEKGEGEEEDQKAGGLGALPSLFHATLPPWLTRTTINSFQNWFLFYSRCQSICVTQHQCNKSLTMVRSSENCGVKHLSSIRFHEMFNRWSSTSFALANSSVKRWKMSITHSYPFFYLGVIPLFLLRPRKWLCKSDMIWTSTFPTLWQINLSCKTNWNSFLKPLMKPSLTKISNPVIYTGIHTPWLTCCYIGVVRR